MNIVIVDDSKLMRIFLENLVDQFRPSEEKNIILFSNGQEALNYLQEGHYIDLILTDVKMPIMDGITFLRNTREILGYKKTPVIVITSTDILAAEVVKDNFTYFLKKPYDPDILKKLIMSIVR